MEHEQHQITRALFEENLAEKLQDPTCLADISPLLSDGYKWDPEAEAPIEALAANLALVDDPCRKASGINLKPPLLNEDRTARTGMPSPSMRAPRMTSARACSAW
jgi:hypothetical protein